MYKLPAMHAGAYAERDAEITLGLWQEMKKEIVNQDLEDIFDLESEIDDVQDVFNNNMKEKAELLGFTDKSGDVDLIDRISTYRKNCSTKFYKKFFTRTQTSCCQNDCTSKRN